MDQRRELGRQGEQLAREYLRSKGYQIYDTNVDELAEIDIIAIDRGDMVFVEVKTRTVPYDHPDQLVTAAQKARICRAADRYIRSHNVVHEPRFDIVAVVLEPGAQPAVDHYEDAFRPGLRAL